MDELSKAITKSSDSAVGLDDIHYQMLKHLPESALSSCMVIIAMFPFYISCFYTVCNDPEPFLTCVQVVPMITHSSAVQLFRCDHYKPSAVLLQLGLCVRNTSVSSSWSSSGPFRVTWLSRLCQEGAIGTNTEHQTYWRFRMVNLALYPFASSNG